VVEDAFDGSERIALVIAQRVAPEVTQVQRAASARPAQLRPRHAVVAVIILGLSAAIL
jgi:hypothetical protein